MPRKRKRSMLEVKRDVLSVLADEPRHLTELLRYGNVAFNTWKKMRVELMEKKFIEVVKPAKSTREGRVYGITEFGKQYLFSLINLLNEEFEPYDFKRIEIRPVAPKSTSLEIVGHREEKPNFRVGPLLLLFLIVVATLGGGAVMSLLTFSKTVTAQGTIQVGGTAELEIYDSLGNVVSNLDWGILTPGGQKIILINVRNKGTVPLKLWMKTDTWVPTTASQYISLAWNMEARVISPGSTFTTTLVLNISGSIQSITSFSFNIVIGGSEA